jgi:hypothetical protein
MASPQIFSWQVFVRFPFGAHSRYQSPRPLKMYRCLLRTVVVQATARWGRSWMLSRPTEARHKAQDSRDHYRDRHRDPHFAVEVGAVVATFDRRPVVGCSGNKPRRFWPTGLDWVMRTFRRTAIILIFTILAVTLSSPARAVCSGDEDCGPSPDEVRAKVEQLLDSAFVTPHAIISLENFNGRDVGTPGQKKYEMRFFATVSYSGDRLRCRRDLCPELHNYLLEIDAAAKRANVAGWLFFEQAQQGWR